MRATSSRRTSRQLSSWKEGKWEVEGGEIIVEGCGGGGGGM